VEEPPKEPSPEPLTLEEYYAKQGVNLDDLDKKKREQKEGKKDISNADWVAKEKLTVVKSKQDNPLEGETRKVATLRNQVHKIEFTPEQELLGFTSQAPQVKKEPREQR